jgi:3-keto-5-aminohexanoate cleavage enzyme
MSDAVIIEAAINGMTTKSRNPNVPISEDELVADAHACFEAGASIVHHHLSVTRLGGEEAAEAYLGVWRRVLADRPDALWYPTINIGPSAQWYDHIAPLARSGLLRMSLSDPGSVNLGGRRDGVPSGSFVYANSFDAIAHQFSLCHEHQLGPSIAVYEPGFLRTVLAYQQAGALPRGSFVKLYLSSDRGLTGAPFGLPPTVTALTAYLELLTGTGLPWAVSAVGDDLGRTDVCRAALGAGGHLHVGLEFYGGDRTPTNAELVSEAVEAAAAAGRSVASCDQAASILGLPRGAEAVGDARRATL